MLWASCSAVLGGDRHINKWPYIQTKYHELVADNVGVILVAFCRYLSVEDAGMGNNGSVEDAGDMYWWKWTRGEIVAYHNSFGRCSYGPMFDCDNRNDDTRQMAITIQSNQSL